VTGAVIGLLFGLGVVLALSSGRRERRPAAATARPRLAQRTQALLAEAGYPMIRPAQLLGVCAASAVAVFVLAAGVSGSAPIGVAFAGFAGYAPVALVRLRRRQRAVELREVWPDLVDNLASAVRAGLGLPEALADLAVRGPEPLRGVFAEFGRDFRATGRFDVCLDRLKGTLADPTGDRIVESLRLARAVGGNDLGRLLRTLGRFIREDTRVRAEIEARQSWTVNAARLALAAPWVVLGLFALRPQAVHAYNSPLGALVLATGGGVTLLAYRIMLRVGRLPTERRVLR
jgi:tight adherence protein B